MANSNYRNAAIKYFNSQTGMNYRSFSQAAAAFYRMKGGTNKDSLIEALSAYYGKLNLGIKSDGKFFRRGLTTEALVATYGSTASATTTVTFGRQDLTAFLYVGSNVSTNINSAFAGASSGNGTQFRVEWITDAPELDIRVVGVNSNYDLYIDGYRAASAPVTTDSSGGTFYYNIKFPAAKTRRFSLCGINTGFNGVKVPAGYTVTATNMDKPFIWQLGDSYTFGTQATQQSFNDFRMVCDYFDMFGIADGIGGSAWNSTSPTALDRIDSKFATLSHRPAFVILSLAYNDAGGNMTTLSQNFTDVVNRIRQLQPSVKIIIMGTATPLGGNANLLTVTNTIKGLCSTLVLPYVDMYDVVNTSNSSYYTSGDNTHPNDAGYTFRAETMVSKLRPLLLL